MSGSNFRLCLAVCALGVMVIFLFFAIEKGSNDERAAIALERLANKYAPVNGKMGYWEKWIDNGKAVQCWVPLTTK